MRVRASSCDGADKGRGGGGSTGGVRGRKQDCRAARGSLNRVGGTGTVSW